MLLRFTKQFQNLTHMNRATMLRVQNIDQTLTSQMLLSQKIKPRKRTKTVCTIGPSSQDPNTIIKLIDQGLSVARLNFNHGDHQKQAGIVSNVREALKKRKSGHVSIMMDLKGPTIRTGYNQDPKGLIQLKKATDYNHLGNNKRIACSYADLPRSTQIGKKILMADGGISTRVLKVKGQLVTVEVLNDGKIGSRKNMCLPGATINLPTITKNDQNDVINFGLPQKVNYICISFARFKKDVQYLRNLIMKHDPQYGKYVQIISKIQNHEGIKNIDQIIQASDGVMVARGDLGMQVPIQKVVILQKYIANRVINGGKFCITATQMLESMEQKPRPTRAQVSDVTNSIFDLSDANMTSGQTSIGLFPIQTAGVLKSVAQQAQSSIDYKKLFQSRKYKINFKDSRDIIGSVALAFQLDCHFIFVVTDSISLVSKISALRPKAYIIVFTDNLNVKGALAIKFGIYCYTKAERNPKQFLQGRGFKYGYNQTDPVRILQIETQDQKVVSTRLFRNH